MVSEFGYLLQDLPDWLEMLTLEPETTGVMLRILHRLHDISQ